MTSQTEQTLLILGASGDLAGRLLVPGLGDLVASGAVEGVSLVGSAVHDWNDERWRSRVAESFAATGATGERIDSVANSTRYIKADVTADCVMTGHPRRGEPSLHREHPYPTEADDAMTEAGPAPAP